MYDKQYLKMMSVFAIDTLQRRMTCQVHYKVCRIVSAARKLHIIDDLTAKELTLNSADVMARKLEKYNERLEKARKEFK